MAITTARHPIRLCFGPNCPIVLVPGRPVTQIPFAAFADGVTVVLASCLGRYRSQHRGTIYMYKLSCPADHQRAPGRRTRDMRLGFVSASWGSVRQHARSESDLWAERAGDSWNEEFAGRDLRDRI